MTVGAGSGADGVVIGVLTFESLREGDLAVSSLFLEDDTGKGNQCALSSRALIFLVVLLNRAPSCLSGCGKVV